MTEKPADDMVKQLWDLGNLTTAFTVAQSLSVMYFSLEKTATVHAWLRYSWGAVFLILSGSGLYAAVIWACYRRERTLRASLHHPTVVMDTSSKILQGRIVTVFMFNGMAALITILAMYRG